VSHGDKLFQPLSMNRRMMKKARKRGPFFLCRLDRTVVRMG
jgi:hypothetical protein